MTRLLIFGLGYSAKRIGDLAVSAGLSVRATGSDGDVAFGDADAVLAALREADLVLSSVPPGDEGDPVLARYGKALAGKRLAYLSSTGVYGDTGGAWVDESAPVATGRRTKRAEADSQWLALHARVFRLPGIYGPGRSAFERVASGKAHRIDLPGQVFSRVHVEDIAQGVMAGWQALPGAYNLADDLPASQNAVIEEACRLLGVEPPPLVSLEEVGLSPMARGFYAENRRVANGKARRVLGFRPLYPTYREGLRSML
ncbi:SDR family NAD(P)-dependent oxidoreductase [Aurantiacibacter xanthus]|uniref:SDR family NAD(P)-dependent oxidoreductase n=1 Tax=Aurantiacibacter xanthus TaxID=1784712 RepID=A0A3A1P0N7_9SPHN|nr:SDR family NAD(P)-dependent oxidoreductase [Aurantiacibacter xanthus]RIV81773.1 SDR family NAD(P)-dependent oxidoreductase [Aurantiacibacter xanthus]